MRRVVQGVLVGTAVALIAGAGFASRPGHPSGAVAPTPTSTATPASRDAVRAGAALAVRPATSGVTVLADEQAGRLALAASRTLLSAAPTVVLAPAADAGLQATASVRARRLHAPLLLTGTDDGAVRAELDRLGTRTLVAYGPAGPALLAHGRRVAGATASTPANAPPPAKAGGVALVRPGPTSVAAVTTARASGIAVRTSTHADPRTDRATAAVLTRSRRIVVLGTGFGSTQVASYTVRAAQRGLMLPGGGQVVFPGRRMVALYGHPGTSLLGVLGEQGLRASIARAKRVARPYAALSNKPVIPTFELIATVASGSKGKDGDYSNEAAIATLKPWVLAAHRAGMYVVLDLQPGRASLLSQAKRYRSLLALPWVGLALDPEWRLRPGQQPLSQIGSVDAREVNAVGSWLAALTRKDALPQKVFVLHQFQTQMIRHRGALDLSHPELAVLIHADGQGTQGAKRGTWNALHADAPRGVFWGWKNFYDEDKPTLSARKTYAISPRPDFVSYQ